MQKVNHSECSSQQAGTGRLVSRGGKMRGTEGRLAAGAQGPISQCAG